MAKWVGESILSFLFAATGIYFWVASSAYGSLSGAVGSAHFPKLLGALLFLLGGTNFYQAASKRERGEAEAVSNVRLFGGAFLSVTYIFLIPILGYFYVTPVFAVCLLTLLGYRNPVKVVLVSAGFTLIAYVVFYRILSVALPV
ncbi:hypothetical protein FACS1894187_13390 [Synergistales bacterium]|nr:hypothetical protein FACS1894187_13390 [Synergistales bacterium]